MTDKNQFISLLKENMELLKNELTQNVRITNKGYKIFSRVLVGSSNKGSAYLSCTRNPQEESVDLTIDVFFKTDSVLLDSDIYWSDGSFIEDLGSREIALGSLTDMKLALDEYFNYLIKNELKKYSDFILSQ